MAEVYEKSKDYPAGVVPFNKAVIPAANILTINGKWIGFVQSIEPTQARDVTEQYEIGSIGPVDMLPGQPAYTLNLQKTKIYLHNAMQVFMEQGYKAKGYEVKDAIKGQMVGDDANKEAEVFFNKALNNADKNLKAKIFYNLGNLKYEQKFSN